MADPANWKAKYIEVSREYEERERAWLELEKILRRLIGKLCAVGMGADERLDLHLTTVAKVSRGNSTVVELQALSDSLSDAVLALEKSAAPQSQLPGLISAPAGPELKQASSASQLRQNLRSSAPRSAQGNTGSLDTIGESIASVLELLEQLSAMDPTNPRAASLAVQLDLVTDDQQFAAVLTDVTELVREHAQSASRDRHDAAAMLAQISNRLAEMAAYLCSSRDENAQTQRDLTELNIEVHDEVGEISRQANSIADLASLRALISERLETVASRVREFRTRQEDRFRANAVRIERLRARITELESETTRLHRGLAEEREHPRTDLLTGLENKTTFEARLTESIVRRKQAAAPLTLLIWDIDFFKRINDEYSHRAGDAVLKEIAHHLKVATRSTDQLARYGSEEFVMALSGTGLAEAIVIANKIREAIAGLKFGFRGKPVKITLSAGLTEVNDDDNSQSALNRAEVALYRAKAAGRNCCLAG